MCNRVPPAAASSVLFFREAATVVILFYRGELMMAERALVCLGRFDFVAFADDAKPITLFFLSEVLGLAFYPPNLALLDSLEPLLGACWLCASDIDF